MKMINVRVGSNDLQKARRFYDATFGALGLPPSASPASAAVVAYKIPDGPLFAVASPRDGQSATHANGGTILFSTDTDDQVMAWHAAGLANGGVSEGEPEAKPKAGGKIGAYLRDPDGNKLGVYSGLELS